MKIFEFGFQRWRRNPRGSIAAPCVASGVALILFALLATSSPWRSAQLRTFGPSARDFDTYADSVRPIISVSKTQPLPTIHASGSSLRIGSPVRVDNALTNAQNWEPSVLVAKPSISGSAQDEVVVLWTQGRELPSTQTDTHLMQARSTNGGTTFFTSEFVAPGGASGIPYDAMSAFDPVTGTTFVGAMADNTTTNSRSVWVASEAKNQSSFGSGVVAATGGFVDKGWMASGPLPDNPAASALYIAYSSGLQRSVNGGQAFSSPIPIDPLITAGYGVGFQPRVGPNGELTVSYYAEGGSIAVGEARFVTSNDGGKTLSAPSTIASTSANIPGLASAVSGDFRVAPFVIHARDAISGTIYAVYNDVTSTGPDGPNVDVLMKRSTNGGTIWSTARIVNSDSSPPSAQFHPWLDIDATGRLHLLYLDNRRHPTADSDSTAYLDVYYSFSEDGGQTWQEHRLTSAPLDSSITNWSPYQPGSEQFIGDYLGMAVSPHAVYLAYPGNDLGEIAMYVVRVDLDDTMFTDGFDS